MIGRKKMITITYALSGILLAISGWMFQQGMLTATTQAIAWSVIFFFASSAASSAYLTVSEIFPLEIRGLAIAIFYALGTLVGGVAAPFIFGLLIQTESRTHLLYGYLAGVAPDDRRGDDRGVHWRGRGTEIVGVGHQPALKSKAGGVHTN